MLVDFGFTLEGGCDRGGVFEIIEPAFNAAHFASDEDFADTFDLLRRVELDFVHGRV